MSKNVPPPGGHVFHPTRAIFELLQEIIWTNLLTKFHVDWTINELTRKNALPPRDHVFQQTTSIFELIQDIITKNILTKFHDEWTINVTKSVNKKNAPPLFHEDQTINVASRVLTRYIAIHCNMRKNAAPPGGHILQPTGNIFELVQDIWTNLLTKFHDDQTINEKCPAAIFQLIQVMIGTNLLNKFHEDGTINVASRLLTRHMLMRHDGQKAITKAHHEYIVPR
ncbi:hypothetical protein DPMN_097343 [Dreissena polymorpha]|uniref:Uncharacterized protein n=1 Tax=Dreissena polymorpha TaxID=45954 RepID=A0A9D4LBM0_DREPO|nr:hypothetical protein DPMN_097343 [Dreissena polymorpha]